MVTGTLTKKWSASQWQPGPQAMALRATLECDLPRQDLGSYQEERGGGPEPLRCVP